MFNLIFTAHVTKGMFSQASVCPIQGDVWHQMHHGIGHMVTGGWSEVNHLLLDKAHHHHPGQEPPPSPLHPNPHHLPLDNTPPPGRKGHWPTTPSLIYGNYGQCAGGTHPTGMHSCQWYVSGNHECLYIVMVWCNSQGEVPHMCTCLLFSHVVF